MKLCKDCIQYKKWWLQEELSSCTHPESVKVNKITGKKEFGFCTVNRQFDCGTEGNWFEERRK